MNTSLRLLATDIACSRGERRLFSGLSFGLSSGEALTVTGPNGTGKTSLLRLVAGFVRPDAGSVALMGAKDDLPLSDAIHFVGLRDGLKAALTVRENLDLTPLLHGRPGLAVEAAAARLDLSILLDLPVAVLSAGQRRRAALARLLVAERPIWLLDEPTAALDAASSGSACALMAEHLARGGMAIAATHLPLGLPGAELTLSGDGSFSCRDAAA